MIKSIPVCSSSMEDKMAWPYISLGQYTVQSGNRFLTTEDSSNHSTMRSNLNVGLWKLIWGLSIPNKVKNFLWRSCRDAFLVKVNLKRRKIIPTDTCEHCNEEAENVIHALWECPAISQVWRSLPEFGFHDSQNFSTISNIILYAHKEDKSLEKMTMLMWTI